MDMATESVTGCIDFHFATLKHPRHLAQPELLDLAGAGLRQFDEHDVARALEARKP